MGLFNLFKKEPSLISVDVKPGAWQSLPQGNNEVMVYVYDGRPLADVPEDEPISLYVVPNPPAMKSAVTHGIFNPRQAEGVGLAYNGYMVGVVFKDVVPVLREFAREVENPSVFAIKHGEYVPGVPLVKILMPSDGWFLAKSFGYVVDPCSRLTKSFVSEKCWTGRRLNGVAEISLEFLPVKKGSSAKPRIRLVSDGETLAEVGGRQHCYKTLSWVARSGEYLTTDSGAFLTTVSYSQNPENGVRDYTLTFIRSNG